MSTVRKRIFWTVLKQQNRARKKIISADGITKG
jgi:hypothetical protein